jgi:alpha-ribazole phosphatase
MAGELVIVRHAPVAEPGICYGQSNPPFLLEPGAVQRLHQELEVLALEQTVFWSSPAERCVAIAREIAGISAEPLICDPRLWELNMGAWEGLPYWELEPQPEFQHWMETFLSSAPPGGETVDQLSTRVNEWVANLDRERDHLVIAHAGTIRALTVLLDGATWSEAMGVKVPHLTPIRWRLVSSIKNTQAGHTLGSPQP